ncbi:hypothetical protein GCM10025868_35280 [Angustibacter aerolatus]|uniref:Uncharacterized protein n=1 Tax=Angustibacter aerolatus TaxID=1162965 RepID=A0ABQ6JLK3_9ACTN|nr:hypothetical protein GCM10025868_35280 [Angustibacter aerolatus]
MLRLGEAGAVPTGVVVVAPPNASRSAADLQRLLEAERLGVSVLGAVAHDEKGAEALGGNWSHRAGRSLLVRSVRGLVPAVEALVHDRRAA